VDLRRRKTLTTLSTHVLDIARGEPAADLALRLYAIEGGERRPLGEMRTNADGRTDVPLGDALPPGTYEIVFAAGPYFARRGEAAFYDDIAVRFVLDGSRSRCHVPLLLSPFGYSTYRGS
jgi:5-hydroxyisourate hydrolase